MPGCSFVVSSETLQIERADAFGVKKIEKMQCRKGDTVSGLLTSGEGTDAGLLEEKVAQNAATGAQKGNTTPHLPSGAVCSVQPCAGVPGLPPAA